MLQLTEHLNVCSFLRDGDNVYFGKHLVSIITLSIGRIFQAKNCFPCPIIQKWSGLKSIAWDQQST